MANYDWNCGYANGESVTEGSKHHLSEVSLEALNGQFAGYTLWDSAVSKDIFVRWEEWFAFLMVVVRNMAWWGGGNALLAKRWVIIQNDIYKVLRGS